MSNCPWTTRLIIPKCGIYFLIDIGKRLINIDNFESYKIDEILNTIIVGDCKRILPLMPNHFADMVITSPPYWKLRDYGMKGQIGQEKTPDEYIEALLGVFGEIKRALKPRGSLWINLGDQYYKKDLMGLPWQLILNLKKYGWILRNTCIWQKTNPLPASVKDRLNHDYEYLFQLVKNRNYYYNLDSVRVPHKTAERFSRSGVKTSPNSLFPHSSGELIDSGIENAPGNEQTHISKISNPHSNELPFKAQNPRRQPGHPHSQAFHPLGKNPGSIISIPADRSWGEHPATFPRELCRIPILTTCPPQGIVLDPFAGKGSSLIEAARLGRNFVGIEINPDYIRSCRTRN